MMIHLIFLPITSPLWIIILSLFSNKERKKETLALQIKIFPCQEQEHGQDINLTHLYQTYLINESTFISLLQDTKTSYTNALNFSLKNDRRSMQNIIQQFIQSGTMRLAVWLSLKDCTSYFTGISQCKIDKWISELK